MSSSESISPAHCFDAFANRLVADIRFLEHRLELLQNQSSPNPVTIRLHKDLLKNRKLALENIGTYPGAAAKLTSLGTD